MATPTPSRKTKTTPAATPATASTRNVKTSPFPRFSVLILGGQLRGGEDRLLGDHGDGARGDRREKHGELSHLHPRAYRFTRGLVAQSDHRDQRHDRAAGGQPRHPVGGNRGRRGGPGPDRGVESERPDRGVGPQGAARAAGGERRGDEPADRDGARSRGADGAAAADAGVGGRQAEARGRAHAGG